MLIISFDAVGDCDLDRLMALPAFSKFYKESAVFRGIPTLCPSNTYPIHTSVATGVLPKDHGIISNTKPFPELHPWWIVRESKIRAKTIWQAAYERGIDVAAVFWPVTGFSKTIRYNIPEIMPRPGVHPLFALLKAGSRRLLLKVAIRHHKLLDGIKQPNRDCFAAMGMADILRKHKPGLAMMHLTAFDALSHANGRGDAALNTACESLDRNLALLLDAAGNDRDVLIFSDHCQRDVHTVLDPNKTLVENGLLTRKETAYAAGESGCYFECCGGTAFFHAGKLNNERIDALREEVRQSEGFRRFLTQGEMRDSGYERVAFGFSAADGYSYASLKPGHKSDHGYPPDMPDYEVFYMARGFGLKAGSITQGGSLLDIAPLMAKALGCEGVGMAV
ncbi:MAG: alkaline phosphatase family protein [Oscillospiraceae bacterium]|nr:alkaline phosphatase family protein [Oscillospiraceae bacterium]